MGVDARTCQDEEVLNAFPHGVFKEPKVLAHCICCALEPFLLCRALVGCQYLQG